MKLGDYITALDIPSVKTVVQYLSNFNFKCGNNLIPDQIIIFGGIYLYILIGFIITITYIIIYCHKEDKHPLKHATKKSSIRWIIIFLIIRLLISIMIKLNNPSFCDI